jgi:hypothetical protein
MMKRFNIIVFIAFLINAIYLWTLPCITYGEEYHTYALFIGIPDEVWVNGNEQKSIGDLYLDDKINNLEKDLLKYFDGYDVMTKSNETTKNRIKDKLLELQRKEIDIFFLYYGGHGDYGHYVTVSDTNISSMNSFLDINELLKLAAKIGKKRAIVMEACKMKVDGAHPTTEIDGGKLKLPLQTKESNLWSQNSVGF